MKRPTNSRSTVMCLLTAIMFSLVCAHVSASQPTVDIQPLNLDMKLTVPDTILLNQPFPITLVVTVNDTDCCDPDYSATIKLGFPQFCEVVEGNPVWKGTLSRGSRVSLRITAKFTQPQTGFFQGYVDAARIPERRGWGMANNVTTSRYCAISGPAPDSLRVDSQGRKFIVRDTHEARPRLSTPPVPPMKIVGVSVDSVCLTRPLTLTIRVFAGYELKDVSAGILAGEGYRIESQATTKVGLLKGGDTASFSGVILPLAKGTWKVQVSARGLWAYDTAAIHLQDEFYIHLSDTLNRAFTADEWIRLCGPRDRLQRRLQRDSSTLKPSAKPPIDDSRKPEMPPRKHQPNADSVKTKLSGTFNLIGYLEFHDPRIAPSRQSSI